MRHFNIRVLIYFWQAFCLFMWNKYICGLKY